mgnify:CR=1 FL=1
MGLNDTYAGKEHAPATLKILLLVFAVVLVGSLAYLVLSQSNSDAVDYSTTNKKTVTAETPDWKIYTNSNFGFSFEYPNSWELFERSDKNGVLPPEVERDIVTIDNTIGDNFSNVGEGSITVNHFPSVKSSGFLRWFNESRKIVDGRSYSNETESYTTIRNTSVQDIIFLGGTAKLQHWERTEHYEASPTLFDEVYFVMGGTAWNIMFATEIPDSASLKTKVFDNFINHFKVL